MNKTFIRFFTVFILALLTPWMSQAQNKQVLTLEQCIQIAQGNSPLARTAKFNLIAAKWNYRSFRADLLPSLSLEGDAPNFNKSIFSNTLDDGTITFSQRTQSEASVGLSINQQFYPTGGRLSLSTGLTRLGIFNNEQTYLWQSTPLVVGINQPIFQFNSLKWRNRTEPLRFKISKKRFVEDMENLAFNTAQRFFDVLLAQINIEVAEFNLAVNDSIYSISQGRYNTGTIAENELLQSELAFLNAESALATAKINYLRTINDFKLLLGLPLDAELEVLPPAETPEVSVSIQKGLELANENNSTALQFRLNEIVAKRDLEQATRQSLFSANVIANFGLNQTSADFEDLYSDPQNRQFFTVGFEVPIFNWGKQRAQINAARNQQKAVANDIAYQQQLFDLQVQNTIRDFLQLRSQVELASKSDTIAIKRYDVTKNRYLIGRVDVTNLNIAQNERDSARRSYIQALRNFWSGWYDLRRLTLYDFVSDEPIFYQGIE